MSFGIRGVLLLVLAMVVGARNATEFRRQFTKYAGALARGRVVSTGVFNDQAHS
jgi:uncharacterized membrane protein YebE (DUF533 family)